MRPSSSPYLLTSRWAWRRTIATFSLESVQPSTSYRELNTSVLARSVLHCWLSSSTLELDSASLLELNSLLELDSISLLEEAMLLEEGRTASLPLRSSPTFTPPQRTS